MRKILYLFLFLHIITAQFSFAQTVRHTSFDERENCQALKGVWREFGNGCVDRCKAKMNPMMLCSMAITYGCDCGKDRCWDGKQCVNIADFKVIFDEEERIRKEHSTIEKEKRKEAFMANRRAIVRKLKGTQLPSGQASTKENQASNEAKEPHNTGESNTTSHMSAVEKLLKTEPESTPSNNRKFQIPPFFLKKQEAEKKAAEAKAATKEENESKPVEEAGAFQLPNIPLPD
jgi:hypothetical protein